MSKSFKILKSKKKPTKQLPKFMEAVKWIGIANPVLQPSEETGEMFSTERKILGTGFYIKNKPYIVTCHHVISPFLKDTEAEAGEILSGVRSSIREVLLVGSAYGFNTASVVGVDMKHDIAILEEHVDKERRKKHANAFGFKFGKEFPNVGERVAYAGYPMGDALCYENHHATYAEGAIGSVPRSTPDLNKIQITGPTTGGYSGGPLFSRYNQETLYGMVYEQPSERGASDAAIFYAVGANHVHNLLNCF